MSRKLKIGGATVNQTPIDWKKNTQNILDAIRDAQSNKIDILCFPELAVSGYGCEDLFLSDWLSDKSWEEIERIAKVCENITVCIGVPFRFDSITYNGACVIQNKNILGVTLKQNLARDGVHYETRWFNAWQPHEVTEVEKSGNKIKVGDLLYECKGITFGFEICEDAWRSIRPGAIHHERGAEILLNPSASHFALLKSTSREKLVIESSKEFQCVYMYVNLLGNEAGRMIYDGDILIAHKGNLLLRNKRLSFQPFNLSWIDVDFDEPSQSGIELEQIDKKDEFTQVVSLALFNYLVKSKAKGFVISLSGGADSACCAVLVSEMVRRGIVVFGCDGLCGKLGIPQLNNQEQILKHLLTCAYQETENSTGVTVDAANALAKSIHADYYHWNIDAEINSYSKKIEKVIGRKLDWVKDDITLQNIQARSRSPIIWMLANIKKSILITTSNRSEGDVGYATMDGDTSGSLAPILGVDKVFIMEWLVWAENKLGYKGLSKINNLKPTAELRPASYSQTDEDDLMPYDILVQIEKLAILERKSPKQIFENLNGKIDPSVLIGYIKKFFRMWAASQWKRERMAPSFHLDELSVDPKSWCRFPILSGNFEEELSGLSSE